MLLREDSGLERLLMLRSESALGLALPQAGYSDFPGASLFVCLIIYLFIYLLTCLPV